MTERSFAHLHCHSHYSLLDGAGRIGDLLGRAKELGMSALAITDHGNMHGAVEFYSQARDKGINPIIGIEAYVAPGSRFQKEAASMKEASFHLTLLAQNRIGFKNLLKLSSAAFLEGYYYKPRIDREILAAHSEGLICLSGCASSELNRALISGKEPDIERAMEVAAWFAKLFGDRYFIEIQDNGAEVQRLVLEPSIELARRMGIPLVATSDVHYVRQEDAVAQDILLCVNTGRFRTDTNRMKMDTDLFYLRGPEEMYATFPGQEDAVRRSQEIADSVDIQIDLKTRHFPVFTPPEGEKSEDYLKRLCLEGLRNRYADVPKRWENGALSKEVMDRLDRELGVINKLGFPNYFLIVWDFVHEARRRGIQCTARGSGVGSLVAYALYLSHVCPLEFDLLFERFLDPSREEAPDIDIDFCQQRRGEMIQYVKDKYGVENVCQIGTFGTLGARAALRDVGRALGLAIPRVDQVVSHVPDELHIHLKDALEKSEELKKLYNADPEIRELVDLAMKVEGLARNVGTHAAAVVIADRPVSEYAPVQRLSGKEEVITQWAMADVEKSGLLKMDFLGLRNLTILSKVIELIEQTTGTLIDPYSFPLDDAETYALLRRGETKGVFQLESGGIRDLLQRMKPDNFRDIIATNALYRPGPLEGGMVDDYIAVKHGRKKPEYKHPVMEEILAETNAVMVYQEQIMRILNRLGGIELANAYKCIKAISKKKESIIVKYQEQFLTGAEEKGLSRKEGEELFELIKKFAGYGFNKCVVGETVVVDAESGARTTVGELFQSKRPFVIHSLGENGKLRPRRVTDVVWNGRKRVYRLVTRQGRVLVATANHPVWTFRGWKNLGDLVPGDRIASARILRVPTEEAWPQHEIIALAGLLSEGNTCHPSCLYFFNDSTDAVQDFARAAEQFPLSVARVTCRPDGRRWEVCVSTGQDARFRQGHVPWNTCANGTATAVKLPTRSGMYRWAHNLGILGKHADEKRVPDACLALRDDDVALLLGRLWSGDGFVGSRGQMPFYATSSEGLARDVQLLLMRLGIVAGVHRKTFAYRYRGVCRERTGYTVHLIGHDSVQRFIEFVLPHTVGRDPQVAAFRQDRLAASEERTSKDTIPAEVREWVDQERRAAGLTWLALQAQSGVSMKEFAGKGSAGKRGFRRGTIAALAAFFASGRLRDATESDVFWDTVAAIEPQGVQDTYDLTVEGEHNFAADGLIVHNSHSTAYALVAYMTAYLKAHYPVEFMAALLSSDIPNRNFKKKDSLVEHLEDCQRMGVEVVRPDIQHSGAEFTVADGKIYFGLSAIKGCGEGAAQAIAQQRKKGGPYRSLFDFCERLDPHVVGRTAIESLICAGALDSLGARRAQLFQVLERALQGGAAAAADRRSGQRSLFGDDEPDDPKPTLGLPDIPEWDERERLNKEKEVLGYYLSSHPLAEHAGTFKTYCSHTTVTAAALPHRSEVMLGGMLSSLKFSHTRNPKPGMPSKYVMFDLEDMDGMIRTIVWPEQFEQYGHLVAPDAILVLRGAIDKRAGSDEANLIVNELISLDDLSARYTRGVRIRVADSGEGVRLVEQLYEILRGYPGSHEVQLLLCLADGTRANCTCEKVRVEIGSEMRRRVDELLGPGSVVLLTAPPKTGGKSTGGGKRENGRRESVGA